MRDRVNEQLKTTNTPLFIRVVLLLVFIGIIALSISVWWLDGLRAVNSDDSTPRNFIIRANETVPSVVSRLSAEGLIRSKTVIFLYIKLVGIDNSIQAGDFRLAPSMTTPEIAHALTSGSSDIWIKTGEGTRVEEIADVLHQTVGIPVEEFLQVAEEGYMFPDSYLLPKNVTASQAAALFRRTFDERVDAQLRADAAEQGLSLEEVVILASLVEREGKTDLDRPVIAGILRKRLREGWTLDIDATLQYATGYQRETGSWWKKTLTQQDKEINSPYNTYRNLGLPPTPISNPSLSSIKAVIYAQESPYWFYIHDETGQVHYGTTLSEHEQNISQYLR